MASWVPSDILARATSFFAIPDDASFWTLINSPFLVAIIATIIGFRLNARLNATQADADTALRMAEVNLDTTFDETANGELTDSYVEDDQLIDEPEEEELRIAANIDDHLRELLDEQKTKRRRRRRGSRRRVVESVDEEFEPRGDTADDALNRSDFAKNTESTRNFRSGSESLARQAKQFIQTQIDRDTDKRHQRTYLKLSANNPIGRAIALRERGRITENQTQALIQFFELWHRYSKGAAANKLVPRSTYEKLKHLSSSVSEPDDESTP